jgi:hypothetical protein
MALPARIELTTSPFITLTLSRPPRAAFVRWTIHYLPRECSREGTSLPGQRPSAFARRRASADKAAVALR